jgi:hypothetical protein
LSRFPFCFEPLDITPESTLQKSPFFSYPLGTPGSLFTLNPKMKNSLLSMVYLNGMPVAALHTGRTDVGNQVQRQQGGAPFVVNVYCLCGKEG